MGFALVRHSSAPGREEATAALAERAAHYGFPERGRVLEVGSALGGPTRFIARRFAATIVCVDMNARMHTALKLFEIRHGVPAPLE
jgi:cyclopropane fatty-acyl-phospholipid synthase-like methyltransferase